MPSLQGSALEPLGYTPHSNMLDAYWQRTAAILAQKPDQTDADMAQEAEDNQQSGQAGKSPAAQALAASQREAIAGPGRLVALQVPQLPLVSALLQNEEAHRPSRGIFGDCGCSLASCSLVRRSDRPLCSKAMHALI